jgi:hypothetical protein
MFLSTDSSLEKKIDKSWITLGGPGSNVKSRHTQEDSANNLVRMMSASTFISAESQEGLHCVLKEAKYQTEYEYGIILRISPFNFPDRVWILCMGFEESGTTGAAWFLSNKWRELCWVTLTKNPNTWFRGSNFAALIQVRRGSDESAVLFSKKHVFVSSQDVFELCSSEYSLWWDPSSDEIEDKTTLIMQRKRRKADEPISTETQSPSGSISHS